MNILSTLTQKSPQDKTYARPLYVTFVSFKPGFPISTRNEPILIRHRLGADDMPISLGRQARPEPRGVCALPCSTQTVLLEPCPRLSTIVRDNTIPFAPHRLLALFTFSPEPGVAGLSYSEWQQTALWAPPPQLAERRSAEHGAQSVLRS